MIKIRNKYPSVKGLDVELVSLAKQIDKENEAKVDKVGDSDIKITDSTKGPVLYDGTDYWRLTVNTSGTIITTKV